MGRNVIISLKHIQLEQTCHFQYRCIDADAAWKEGAWTGWGISRRKKGVYAIGDRIMVFLFEKTDDTPEDPEEKGQVITLDEQVYTRDGIEYAKYITKTIYPGSSRPDYGISIEFEAYGREYAALVWSTRFDEVVKKDMDQILDSLEVDLDVQGKK